MSELAALKQRFVAMLIVDTLLLALGAGFAVAHFAYGLSWGLWAFFGLIVAAFGAQLWFIGGLRRPNKET